MFVAPMWWRFVLPSPEALERYRQRRLTDLLGQVECSDLPHAHAKHALPCGRCGAAL